MYIVEAIVSTKRSSCIYWKPLFQPRDPHVYTGSHCFNQEILMYILEAIVSTKRSSCIYWKPLFQPRDHHVEEEAEREWDEGTMHVKIREGSKGKGWRGKVYTYICPHKSHLRHISAVAFKFLSATGFSGASTWFSGQSAGVWLCLLE